MAIHCRLSALLGERRLKMSDMERDTNISRTAIRGLFYDTVTKAEYRILNEACNYLNCRLEDLLVYTPDPEEKE